MPFHQNGKNRPLVWKQAIRFEEGIVNTVQIMKIRLDVDYAYPSRIKSFIFTALSRKTSKHYLKNAKIIARMIEESPREIQAYWFFSPPTWPDDEMLSLL